MMAGAMDGATNPVALEMVWHYWHKHPLLLVRYLLAVSGDLSIPELEAWIAREHRVAVRRGWKLRARAFAEFAKFWPDAARKSRRQWLRRWSAAQMAVRARSTKPPPLAR